MCTTSWSWPGDSTTCSSRSRASCHGHTATRSGTRRPVWKTLSGRTKRFGYHWMPLTSPLLSQSFGSKYPLFMVTSGSFWWHARGQSWDFMEAQWGVWDRKRKLLWVLVFWPVFATGSHLFWDRLVSLGMVEAGDRCVSVFILDPIGSFKSPVQLLLWKKTCFLLGWTLWVQQENTNKSLQMPW